MQIYKQSNAIFLGKPSKISSNYCSFSNLLKSHVQPRGITFNDVKKRSENSPLLNLSFFCQSHRSQLSSDSIFGVESSDSDSGVDSNNSDSGVDSSDFNFGVDFSNSDFGVDSVTPTSVSTPVTPILESTPVAPTSVSTSMTPTPEPILMKTGNTD